MSQQTIIKMKSNPTTGVQRLRRYTLISFSLLLAACTQFSPIEEKGITNDVKDWPESKDTIVVHPDSVRNATHEDSVRFGLKE